MKATIVLFDLADVAYTIECHPEDCAVRGNAMASGDDVFDRAAEDAIIADLEGGNPWAWCCAVVRATLGPFTGRDSLGGCSYASEAAFVADGDYYPDMKAAALDDLRATIVAAGGVIVDGAS